MQCQWYDDFCFSSAKQTFLTEAHAESAEDSGKKNLFLDGQ